MKRSSFVLVAFSIAGVLLGCRAVLGINDALPVSSEGGSAEAGDNAGAADGASDAGEAAPLVSVFCSNIQPPPGFCSDFDRDPFEKGWDNYGTVPDPGVGGGATLGPDTTIFMDGSAPRSARFTIPQLLPNTNAESLLITTIPKGLIVIEIYVDVRIETEEFTDQVGHVAVVGMSFDGMGGKFVEIRRTKDGPFLYTYDGQELPLLQPFPIGVWKNVELRFAFSQDAGTVTTYIDGVPAGDANLLPDYNQPDVYPRVSVGPSLGEGPMGEFRMNADNVVIRGTLP